LYYRLKVFPISVPPLRERKEDIPLLAGHFISEHNKKTGKRVKGLSQEALRLFMDYPWQGNVRELENAIEHAFVLCSGNAIDIFDLPVELRQAKYHPPSIERQAFTAEKKSPRVKLTRDDLTALLDRCDWNKAEVARRTGLSRTAIWKYMKKWDIPLQPEN
jgi:DNA-binding NtrC family response regulator